MVECLWGSGGRSNLLPDSSAICCGLVIFSTFSTLSLELPLEEGLEDGLEESKLPDLRLSEFGVVGRLEE
jgi:hypothetical protein